MEPAGAPCRPPPEEERGGQSRVGRAEGQKGPAKASGARILQSEGFSKEFSKHRKSCRPALRIYSLVSFLLSPTQERIARDSRALREGAPKDKILGKELGTENPLGGGQLKNRVSATFGLGLETPLQHLPASSAWNWSEVRDRRPQEEFEPCLRSGFLLSLGVPWDFGEPGLPQTLSRALLGCSWGPSQAP